MTAQDNIQEFTEFLYGDVQGTVYLANAKPDGDKIRWTRGFCQWPEDKDLLTSILHSQSLQGKEVYLCVSLLDQKPPSGDHDLKKYFKATNVAVLDFDGNAPEHWSDGQLIPSMRIISSTGDRQHVYFRYTEPVTDLQLAENISRTLTYQYSADLSGWDAVQMIRPPGTVNYGYAKPERQGTTYDVLIEDRNSVRYDPKGMPQTTDFREDVTKNLGNVPSIQEVLAKGQWSDTLWDLYESVPPSGTRSDKLMSLAYQAAECGMSDEYIFAILIEVDSRWQKYFKRTDRDKRYLDIIDRVRSKIPYGLSKDSYQGLLGSSTIDIFKPFYSIHELSTLKVEFKWELEDLFLSGAYGILIGDPGVGKTQMSIQLGLSYARHEPFLKFYNSSGGIRKVMFISMEMNPNSVANFISKIEVSNVEQDLYSFHFPETSLDLDRDRGTGRTWLLAKVEEHKPDLIIIDSLSRAIAGSLSDDNDIRSFNSFMSFLRNKYGVSVLVIHHNRKKGQGYGYAKNNSPELDDVYGSRFITAEADLVMAMTSDALHTLKNRASTWSPPVHFERNGVQFDFKGEINGPQVESETVKPPVEDPGPGSGPTDDGETDNFFGKLGGN